jgi:hypothetical protein
LLQENKHLKAALEKEKERNNSPGEMTDYINILENYLLQFNEKIEKMQDNFKEILHNSRKMTEEKFAELDNKIINIENLTSKFLKPYVYTITFTYNNFSVSSTFLLLDFLSRCEFSLMFISLPI